MEDHTGRRCPMGRFHVGGWEGIAASVQQRESVDVVEQDEQAQYLVDVVSVVMGEELGHFYLISAVGLEVEV